MKNTANTFVISALIACILFSCKNKSEKKNVEQISTEQQPIISKNELADQPIKKEHPGQSVYAQYCQNCHQTDGSGVINMYPPLGIGSWVEKEPNELIAILMKGMSGKIEVNGEVYKNFMPSQAQLTNEEMADVLSYIRSNFGNNLEPVTHQMVKKIRSGR